MKVGIFSHCTIDTIVYENEQYEAAGGPASYCSFTARKQKHDVNLYTKFDKNYPLEEFFKENKICLFHSFGLSFLQDAMLHQIVYYSAVFFSKSTKVNLVYTSTGPPSHQLAVSG